MQGAAYDSGDDDMSLNSNSISLHRRYNSNNDATVHSTGAFSSLGYTHVLEGAAAHPAWGVPAAAGNDTDAMSAGAGTEPLPAADNAQVSCCA